jgi:ribosomal protein S18 acetylase RimI-like enzyme
MQFEIICLGAHPDPENLNFIRGLFRQYADSLGFDLGFQGFAEELAALPGDYAPPRGRLLLALAAAGEGATAGGRSAGGGSGIASGLYAAGCAALRPLHPQREPDTQTCEMKRLYVPPAYRGQGLGRRLAERLIAEAREAGYRRMRLDSIDFMKEALGLYRALGFREIPPYRYNPIPGAVYLELELGGS